MSSGSDNTLPRVTAGSRVTLREVTRETVREIADLEVGPEQRGAVVPNGVSIAEAHFEPGAWFRAIYAGDIPVGFVMLFDPALPGASPDKGLEASEIGLWRLMIDRRYQGLGFGRAALDLVLAHARGRPGVERLVASYLPGSHGPEGFYGLRGFSKTGRRRNRGREIEVWIGVRGAS